MLLSLRRVLGLPSEAGDVWGGMGDAHGTREVLGVPSGALGGRKGCWRGLRGVLEVSRGAGGAGVRMRKAGRCGDGLPAPPAGTRCLLLRGPPRPRRDHGGPTGGPVTRGKDEVAVGDPCSLCPCRKAS